MKKQSDLKDKKPKKINAAAKAARVWPSASSRSAASQFPVVGIGASAGGLEALELFLKNVPAASGMAFVIIQHMDPTHKGIMAELLGRVTTMKVIQVKDHTRIQPDCVYVIPPDKDMSILHGVLHLLPPVAPRGLRLPIDFFFRSLACDRKEHGIGVILSGMGSDGTLGMRAIKEKSGATFVQDPASAKFDGMPRSAIDAGFADVVAKAEELAGKIIGYLQHVPFPVAGSDLKVADLDQSGLAKVVLILREQTGQDFSLYKKSTIYRRIERRMGLHQLRRIADYVRYLRENPQETQLLFKELLIGVTSFFRDPAVWEQLKTEAIPALLAARPNGGTLRAWVPGCSTGEEAYSLAIVFNETKNKIKSAVPCSLQIFATDLDHEAIDRARTGVYPADSIADVGKERLRRFFVKDENGYRVNKEIREMVIFAAQNLIMDPPFTKLDILSCRNLLIYLAADLQKKLLPLFYYSLNPSGILVLGSSETIGPATDLFAPLAGKTRLYRRKDTAGRMEPVEFPAAFSRTRDFAAVATPVVPPPAFAPNVQAMTESLLLTRYSPAAILTTDRGDIVYISGKTGKYLEPAAGKANLNVFAMAREGLAGALNEAFAKALRQNNAVTLKALPVGTNGGTQFVDVTVTFLSEPAALRGMVLIVFADVVLPPPVKAKAPGKAERMTASGARMAALAQELRQARDEIQTTREEMQTSQEELKSANEELQSTNEELQSTNEELTTSKEEMQSMYEELQTVNHELQIKVDELLRTSDDMKNLLNSTDIATLFLDNELNVRRFTTKTTGIISLLPGDAGRPITDLTSELDYKSLAEDAREVLRSLISCERQVSARDGRWFFVRTMPYRTQDNRIDGVVITFMDITHFKTLETTLRQALSVLQKNPADRTAVSDATGTLENVLRKAQDVLEKKHFQPGDPTVPDS